MQARLTFVHALSPLHAGTGQGVGVIDLPIAREKATGIPFLPGSSLKGTLRDRCTDDKLRKRLFGFGPESTNADEDEHAGAAYFSDQRLLLLPVRSLKGTFAWVTSPYLLQRVLRDAREAGLNGSLPDAVPDLRERDQCVVASKPGALCLSDGQVVLEELDLKAQIGATTWAAWLGQRLFRGDTAWQGRLTERLCIVHDDVLTFLLDTATEVTARIKLNDTSKTVDTSTGALWYEEALPTEAVLSGLLLATMAFDKSETKPDKILEEVGKLAGMMQLGGKATVGRGLCRVLIG